MKKELKVKKIFLLPLNLSTRLKFCMVWWPRLKEILKWNLMKKYAIQQGWRKGQQWLRVPTLFRGIEVNNAPSLIDNMLEEVPHQYLTPSDTPDWYRNVAILRIQHTTFEESFLQSFDKLNFQQFDNKAWKEIYFWEKKLIKTFNLENF